MSTYAKLPSENSKSTSKPIQELSASVKDYEQKLKDLRKLITESKSKKTTATSKALMKKQDEIINLTNSLKSLMRLQVAPSEKQIFDKLKKIAEQLFKQFNDLEQASETVEEKEEDLDPEFVHHESISFQNIGEVDSGVLQERLDGIQNLHKDFHEVNNLFKEVATLVESQGNLLDESEKHVETAVKETSRANIELDSASNYQRSAKKKAVCIFLIVLVVVGILIAVVVATTV